ncbi:MAG TPA: cation:proton antiporter [Sphingobacteriaceae bacterium]
MSNTIIITICSLILLAYVFDITSAKTRIPSVILLLLVGWIMRQIGDVLGFQLPNLTPILSVMGTVGLILIVMEGALELELNKSKLPVIRQSFIVSFFPIIILSLALAYAISSIGGYPFRDSLVNAIPLAVISSSIAIPSAANLAAGKREFVIYESSLSDIFGVLLFDFFVLNDTITTGSFLHFLLQLLAIILISFSASAFLSYLLSKIEHHIKFAPIILLVILIYGLSKIYHLPALVFILAFGLFLGNLDELKRIKWIQKLHPQDLNSEVKKFREISIEAAFVVRAIFFLLFGYVIETAELLNPETLLWAVCIVAGIFLIRAVQLRAVGLPLMPLLFIAPRGLITILLFLSIPVSLSVDIINRPLIIQIIILTGFIMMAGLIFSHKKKEAERDEPDAAPQL